MAANRTKTIEYVWNTNTSSITITNNINTTPVIDLGTTIIDIPETTSRTFTSTFIQFGFRDNAIAIDHNAFNYCRVSLNVDGGGYTHHNFTELINENNENVALMIQSNTTSFFNNNYIGNSHSIGCRVQIVNTSATNIPITNIYAQAVLTYNYDEIANDIRIKTVRIPIGSKTDALTTTLTEIGVNQVPALDAFLPETNITYKQIWFNFWSNRGESNIGDTTLQVALDLESVHSFGLTEGDLFTADLQHFIWDRSDIDTSVTHALKAKCLERIAYDMFGGLLNVTYTYDATNSSSVINSVIIPAMSNDVPLGSPNEDHAFYDKTEFEIMEPGPITLAQSGLLCHIDHWFVMNFYLKTGSQPSYTFYDIDTSELIAGGNHIVHRADLNNGLSITRGTNNIETYSYQENNSRGGSLTSALYLNYTSGVHEDGDGTHNHTIIYHTIPFSQGSVANVKVSGVAMPIIESDYWLTGIVAHFYAHKWVHHQHFISMVLNSGEFQGQGYKGIGTSTQIGDNAPGTYWMRWNFTNSFNQYPNDLRNRMDIEAARKWHVFQIGTTLGWYQVYVSITYHSITYAVSGTVEGYEGDGSDIAVNVWSNNTSSKILNTTTSTGGTYSTIWYSDLSSLFVESRESDTNVGRSDDGSAE